MQFFTEIAIPESPHKLGYQTGIVFMGSCFSENIGQKLIDLKFPVDLNPFGILYNPASIAEGLRLLLSDKSFTRDDLFHHQGLWSSFYHHSRFSDVDPNVALQKINGRLAYSRKFLKNARFLFITFGTSWVYQLKSTNKIVSNCHKIPDREFLRYRLSPETIVEDYQALLTQILQINQNLKIILTLSPVRHWKDGAVENQLSKAVLTLAIDHLVKTFGPETCSYFPSYEIVMDELRDYRFYAEDMIHPNSMAIDYIFERFTKVFISPESLKIAKDVLKIRKASEHRPVNSASVEYKKFLLYNLKQVNDLIINFPFINLDQEKDKFESELTLYENQIERKHRK
jgi:hypothetical protein